VPSGAKVDYTCAYIEHGIGEKPMDSCDAKARSTEHSLNLCCAALEGSQGAEASQGGRCLPADMTA